MTGPLSTRTSSCTRPPSPTAKVRHIVARQPARPCQDVLPCSCHVSLQVPSYSGRVTCRFHHTVGGSLAGSIIQWAGHLQVPSYSGRVTCRFHHTVGGSLAGSIIQWAGHLQVPSCSGWDHLQVPSCSRRVTCRFHHTVGGITCRFHHAVGGITCRFHHTVGGITCRFRHAVGGSFSGFIKRWVVQAPATNKSRRPTIKT